MYFQHAAIYFCSPETKLQDIILTIFMTIADFFKYLNITACAFLIEANAGDIFDN